MCCHAGSVFLRLGTLRQSTGSAQPLRIHLAAVVSVITTRSRPIGFPACSCAWTLLVNSALSLMSSMYLRWPPYLLSNCLSSFLSMYSGQLDHVQLPIATFGWLTVLAFSLWFCACPVVPLTPPQPATSAPAPLVATPMAPSRARNWRRDCSCPPSIRSTTLSIESSCIPLLSR